MQARLEDLADLWVERSELRLGCLGTAAIGLAFLIGLIIAVAVREYAVVGTMLAAAGFITFAVALAWFSLTIVLDRPVESNPGGAGLLAIALGGLVLLIVGAFYPEPPRDTSLGEGAGPDSPKNSAMSPNATEDPIAVIEDLRSQVATLAARLQERDRLITELQTQVATGKTTGGPESDSSADATDATSLAISGPVRAHAAGTMTHVGYVTFGIRNEAKGSVDLSSSRTTVSYYDSAQGVGALPFRAAPPTASTYGWGIDWGSGSGPRLGPGEEAEVTVNLTGLATPLGTGATFSIQVASEGGELTVTRTTPDKLTAVMELK